MATTPTNSLVCRHVFGINNHITDNISFLDEDNYVYIAGSRIIVYNKNDKRQRFIHDLEIVNPITAFGSTIGKRVAVLAEKADNNTAISKLHVYDLKSLKKKKLLVSESFGHVCCCLQISDDEKLIVALSNGSTPTSTITPASTHSQQILQSQQQQSQQSSHTQHLQQQHSQSHLQQSHQQILSVWTWSKSKMNATCMVPATTPSSNAKENQTPYQTYRKMILNKQTNRHVCLFNDTCIKFYTISDTDIRLIEDMNRNMKEIFTSMCWLKLKSNSVTMASSSSSSSVAAISSKSNDGSNSSSFISVHGTMAGNLLLFINGKYAHHLIGTPNTVMANSNKIDPGLGSAVVSLASHSTGLICGTVSGKLIFFKMEMSGHGATQKPSFKLIGEVKIDGLCGVDDNNTNTSMSNNTNSSSTTENGNTIANNNNNNNVTTTTAMLNNSNTSNGIINLVIDPKETRVIATTATGQILSFSIQNLALSNANNTTMVSSSTATSVAAGDTTSSLLTTDSTAITTTNPTATSSSTSLSLSNAINLTYLHSPFHKSNKAIVAIDICSRKPLMVTCSKDNSIKFWNYKKHTMLFSKDVVEDVFSVALHPTGHQIAIGYLDKLRIYHILIDDIKLCLEISVKACRECHFSRGGSKLAMANGSTIVIVDFYTGEKIADLRGHNSKVRGLQWLDDTSTTQLLSCGQEGAVYKWDIRTGKRLFEFLLKGIAFVSIVVSKDDTILVLGNDGFIRELSLQDLSLLNAYDMHSTGNSLSHIVLSKSKKLCIVAKAVNSNSNSNGGGGHHNHNTNSGGNINSHSITSLNNNNNNNSLSTAVLGIDKDISTTSGHLVVFTYPLPVTAVANPTKTLMTVSDGDENSDGKSSTDVDNALENSDKNQSAMEDVLAKDEMKSNVTASSNTTTTTTATSIITTAVSSIPIMKAIPEMNEFISSVGVLTQLKLSSDENFFVTGDDHGNVILYEVHSSDHHHKRASAIGAGLLSVTNNISTISMNAIELMHINHWTDDILITLTELEDKATLIAELRNRLEELHLNHEYQLKLIEMAHTDKCKELNEDHVKKLELSRTRLIQIKTEYELAEKEGKAALVKEKEKHDLNVHELETKYQKELVSAIDIVKNRSKQRDILNISLQEQHKKLVSEHEKKANKLLHQYEVKIREEEQSSMMIKEENKQLKVDLAEKCIQLESDVEETIEGLKHQYEVKLDTIHENALRYKGENGLMKKKEKNMMTEIEESKNEVLSLVEVEKSLHDQMNKLEKEVLIHRKEIKSRDVTIEEKEKKIYELKKKNHELEKYKFVLDFKIKELKLQIEPRQQEIAEMRDKVKETDAELETTHLANTHMDDVIGDLRNQVESLQAILNKKRQIRHKQEHIILERFRSDVQTAIQYILSPPELKAAAIRLVERHGAKGEIKPLVDPDVEIEYNRHRDYLKHSFKKLQADYEKSTTVRVESNKSHLAENMALLTEIQQQKGINSELKQAVQALMGNIRRANHSYQQHKRLNLTNNNSKTKMMTSKSFASSTQGISSNNDKSLLLSQHPRLSISAGGSTATTTTTHPNPDAFSFTTYYTADGTYIGPSNGSNSSNSASNNNKRRNIKELPTDVDPIVLLERREKRIAALKETIEVLRSEVSKLSPEQLQLHERYQLQQGEGEEGELGIDNDSSSFNYIIDADFNTSNDSNNQDDNDAENHNNHHDSNNRQSLSDSYNDDDEQEERGVPEGEEGGLQNKQNNESIETEFQHLSISNEQQQQPPNHSSNNSNITSNSNPTVSYLPAITSARSHSNNITSSHTKSDNFNDNDINSTPLSADNTSVVLLPSLTSSSSSSSSV